MSLAPGTRLGPFEVADLIGAGGMGEVYRARDTKLNRDVALKVLPDTLIGDPDRLARFKREAQTLAALNHPNIAQIHGLEEGAAGPGESGSQGGGPSEGGRYTALVMEFVDGEDLSARIKRGAVPLDEALPIAKQIAEALEAAHDQGIVHRDLKPANIKVTLDGTVKVLDFGLAKAAEASGSGLQASGAIANSPTITTPAMTMRGVILGTAAYMAPEQAKGRAVDRRADIWAFGCVLYEMLTGAMTFDGEDVTEILGSVVKSDPDWTKLPAPTPPAIRTLLKRCLVKNPKQRLDSAAALRLEIADAIASPASEEPQARTAPVSRPSARTAWAAASLFALLAAGLAGVALRPTSPEPMTRLEISTPPTSSPTAFAISPDGRWVAFVAARDGKEVLWVRSLDASSARELPGTTGANRPFWSPDSGSIAYFTPSGLYRIELAGGAPQKLAAAPVGRGGDWSGEGVILFAPTQSSEIFRVSANGGEAIAVTELNEASSHRVPRFLPDQQHFTFVESKGEKHFLKIGSLDKAPPVDLGEVDSNNAGAAYHPAGYLLIPTGGTVFAQPFDMRTKRPVGERVPAVQNDAGSAIAASVSVADNGTFLYRTNADVSSQKLAWRDLRGALLQPQFDGAGAEPDISPDGRRAAVVRANDIWIVDLVRGVSSRFTSDEGSEIWPTWSRDGQHVLFAKPIAYQQALSGERRPILGHIKASQLYPAQWSPDGRYLLYRSMGSQTQGDLWAAMDDGKSDPIPVAVSQFSETRGQFSPDGRWVSYESDESGRVEIYVRPFNRAGAPVRVSVNGGSEARWHPNGRAIFYIGPDSRMMQAAIRPSTAGDTVDVDPPRELFVTSIVGGGTRPLNFKFGYAVASDGERLLINEVLSLGETTPIIVTLNWRPPEGR
jgi:serine/threonine protein kinase